MLKISLRIIAGIAVLAVLLVLAAGLYLSWGRELTPWQEPSGFAEPFDYDNDSFENYVAWSARRIRASRIDSPSEDTIYNLMPFILEPDSDCPWDEETERYPNGILLIHGLIASPWSMKQIGEYFQSRCFYVMGVLLPGHGTRPGDMLDSTWQQWYREVQFATRILSEKVERVYLSGHSIGGTLAVMEAANNPEVDSLILFAPALRVAAAAKYAQYVVPLGKLFPAAAWFELEPEDGVYRYESLPFLSAAQTWDLIQATDAALAANPLTIPVMTVTSAQDTTVDPQAILDFMRSQTNPSSHLLLYSEYDLPPYPNTTIYSSNKPEQGILSLGHLGLMTPPDHPFYGRNGPYHYCSQYYGQDNDDYARCKAGQKDFYGETTPENLAAGLIARITFNPFYDDLLKEIRLFMDQVSMDQRGLPLPPRIPGDSPLDQ